MKNYLKGFLMAMGMFTSIPIRYHNWDDDGAKHMLFFYPLVGFIIGGIWFGLFKILMFFNLPLIIVAAILMLFPYFITGFLHLDGFMDLCDAMLSRRDKEEKLRILKDSHTGAFAVISLACLFILSYSGVSALISKNEFILGLIFIPAISRSFMSTMMFFNKSMEQSSLVKYFKQNVGKVDKVLSVIFLCIIIGVFTVLFGIFGLVSSLVVLLIVFYMMRKPIKELGGISGDIAGYGLVICETLLILALAIM
ncbi:MAG: adenosylcobinamide-GDP ribazoletransferase [Clostridium perfringens]|nr:adenosylcobinamide-GDP ribazoletransferase [Clostridium perfringens]